MELRPAIDDRLEHRHQLASNTEASTPHLGGQNVSAKLLPMALEQGPHERSAMLEVIVERAHGHSGTSRDELDRSSEPCVDQHVFGGLENGGPRASPQPYLEA
ncbi:MAG: hypothetical protein Q8L48_05200 [Archangium sp.]|nr:hypothetical protein [Archangium sp.]